MTTDKAHSFDYDLVVIGGGPAGQRAAVQAAKLQKRVVLIDKQPLTEGKALLNGTLPSKSFKEAVLYLSGFKQRSLYGAGYRVKSSIEMEDLTFRCEHILRNEADVVRDQLRRNNIAFLSGSARLLDPHTVLLENFGQEPRQLRTQFILIATGSRPHRLETIAFDKEVIFDSDDILHIPALPRDLTVVGGGVIGTEYASMFAALGVQVTVVESEDRLIGFLDSEISDIMQYHLRAMGVTLRLQEKVRSVVRRSDGKTVTSLESGKVILGETVLSTTGRVSASNELGLEEVGVVRKERGAIEVNEFFQTTVPNIYAAGDVIGFPALASTASAQGRLASAHAFQILDSVDAIPLPFAIYGIPEIAYVGQSEEELTENNIPYEIGVARFRELSRGLLIGDGNGILKILFHRESLEILGVHILGDSATELIHIGQAVLALKGGLNYFRDAVFNHPTLAEAYKVAALDGFNRVRSALL